MLFNSLFLDTGDLWSFNSASNQFVVSPEPDVHSLTIDVTRHRCLILGTDGLWNMIPPQRAVEVVQHIDRQNKMSTDNPHHPVTLCDVTHFPLLLKVLFDAAMDKPV